MSGRGRSWEERLDERVHDLELARDRREVEAGLADLERQFIMAGSFAAAARVMGPEVAAQVQAQLTERAPEEIQSSWPLVVQYHRAQIAYEVAERLGDVKGMLAASGQQAKLVTDRY